jgi:hypothetical protein
MRVFAVYKFRLVRRAVCILLLAGLAFAGCGRRAANAKKSLFEDAGAAEGLREIVAKLRPPVRALRVDITPATIVLQAQDPAAPTHVNSYTYLLVSGMAGPLGLSWVKGPDPVRLSLLNPLEEELFDLAEVDLKAIPAAIREAIGRVKLEDPATVSGIRIQRRADGIPATHHTEVEWTISLRTDRESAEAVADAKGRIQRVSLQGTRRAQGLDYRKGGEPLAEALGRIRGEFGDARVLQRVSIEREEIDFSARKQGERPGQTEAYACKLSGIYPTFASSFGVRGDDLREEDFFTVAELGGPELARMAELAIAKSGVPNGRVMAMEADRDRAAGAEWPLRWRIRVRDGGGSPFSSQRRAEATVYFTSQGKLLRVEAAKNP